MMNKLVFSVIFIIFFISNLQAQSTKFLQINLSSGLSQPILKFGEPHMFAGRGLGLSGGFDYFFTRLGVGFTAGYFTNKGGDPFNAYVSKRYLENITTTSVENWNTKYILVGPTYKINGKRFEWDFYVKGGLGQLKIPELVYAKTFFNQHYQIYYFTGSTENYQFTWQSGTRMAFKLNHWMGLQAKAEYITTSFLSKFNYNYSFRNAQDGNNNGVIEDSEYFESQKISNSGIADLDVVNIHLGLIFQLGKVAPPKTTEMIPAEFSALVLPTQEEKTSTQTTLIPETPEMIISDTGLVHIQPAQKIDIDTTAIDLPVLDSHVTAIEPVEIPATSYEAPESIYDKDAAEFLYKAGESYFAGNDFENAIPCFNKLKADAAYPRAKYMFALSLSAMGNCAEALSEYNDFSKSYKEADSRTLEIIFASHLERCKTDGKLKNVKSEKRQNNHFKQSGLSQNNEVLEYRIQFIAIKKPNATFPKLVEVGDISSEYFPNKSVYRYTLNGYKDVTSAASDVYKVRKLGFKDAFIAVYENGLRINTLYHSK